jgi:DNA (cytosine-5)-methyltransferase 1
VEREPEIAKIYKDFFPNDEVIVADAHQYLLEHYKEFDFIWASPPCPSHSRIRKIDEQQNPPIFPDMKLYEEILFLQ